MRNLILSLILCAGAYASPFTSITYSGVTAGRFSVTNPTTAYQLFQWSWTYDTTYLDGREPAGPQHSPIMGGGAYVPPGTWNLLFEGGVEPLGRWRTDVTWAAFTTVWDGHILTATFVPPPGQPYLSFVPANSQPFVEQVPEPSGLGLLGLTLLGIGYWRRKCTTSC